MGQITHAQLLNLAGYSLEGNSHSALYNCLETDSRKVDQESVFFCFAWCNFKWLGIFR